jgi:hypothetical protein
MNFITPLLFVFYLQVMPPPPPPTIHGGGDYWAGNTYDSDATDADIISEDWNGFALGNALFGIDGGRGFFRTQRIRINGFNNVITAIENNVIRDLDTGDWVAVLGAGIVFDFERACNVAYSKGGEIGAEVADDFGCEPPEAPLPKELIFLSILSFLLIYSYHNREEFSKFNFKKKIIE